MGKVLGLDLGTNSIGISLRNEDKGGDIINQLEYFSSVIFKSGVGRGKSGEFSYAAQRTNKRSTRRLYQSRKYRIWATLKLLIDNGYCPLSMDDLEKWSKYDKTKGLKRQYPIEALQFEQWVRLDFDGDGIADYSSPYQLRAELIEKQFDFTSQTNRYKLGRALYHIAQRRGFRSSKGETLQEQEKAEIKDIQETDITDALKKSEEKKSGKLVEYMQAHQLKTVGSAFAHLERNGIRVRNSEYQAVRSQYKDEIRQIFVFQNGLDIESRFYKRLVCENKNEGTIFYKRPLRSQKASLGNCTLEPDKPRCSISHPEFEKFRAWCFINNIRFGDGLKESLTLEQKEQLYQDKFLLTRNSFKFEDIRVWIEKRIGKHLDYNHKSINYKDNATVSGCPISGRFKNLLGEDWENWVFISAEEKINKKTGEVKRIKYTTDDLWHICFSFDEPEYVEEFASTKLSFDDGQVKQLVRIYGAIQQGYGMLSLKATKNINRFLQKGLIYTDAVLLAKLPEIFKDKWSESEESIISQIDGIISTNREQRLLFGIVNALIADYKSRDFTDQSAYKNYSYVLGDDDIKDVKNKTVAVIGSKTWASKDETEQEELLAQVAKLYQSFFASPKRDYFKVPKVADALATFLHNTFKYLPEKDLRKIYHPSMIEFYSPADYTRIEDGRSLKLLGSPVIGALKNPMAMRVLHTLRRQVNSLLKTVDENGNALIDEETRIVVETARELNDANMRWAIEAYQREREAENKEYEKIIKEYFPNRDIKDNDIEQLRLTCEQHDIPENGIPDEHLQPKKDKNVPIFKKDVTKYRLWLEQGCRCLYTGKMINIKNLFDDNAYDIEHTIPRSISFDDSLANLTVCEAHFNRSVKKNQLPTQLTNYDDIKLRLLPWFDKVEKLKDNVDFWKSQSKRAQTKDRKDHCIRQRHLWQMELDYWQNKVNRFTMTEVTTGFRNNQLNDTRIITKYAYHYLKTAFNKVEVQRGSVTANFRKMLGVQSLDEKKSRDKHSHHAIDATVLTLIPTAAKRDNMLELFFRIQDNKKQNIDCAILEKELLNDRISCKLDGNVSDIVPYIENNVLVNHISKDQTLTPAHMRKRVRGKIIPKRDSNGLKIFERNADGTFKYNRFGHKIPQAKEWSTGDCIRGQLHKESFFGAIKYPLTDDSGFPLRHDDGEYAYEKDNNGADIITMVINTPIDSFTKEEDFKKILDPVVRLSITRTIQKRISEGMSLKAALKEPIWLTNRNGEFVKQDKNGRPISPIRHVRCKVSAGKGFFTIDKAIKVKTQSYKSRYEYKNTYYAQNDTNYLCLLYEGVAKGKVERQFRFLNYYEVAQLRIKDISQIKNEPYFQIIEDKKTTLNLSSIIKVGTRVLMWNNSPEELADLRPAELSKRLFIVYKFNLKGANCIYLRNHLEARNEIPKNEDYTIFDENKRQPLLTLVANGFNCLIEGRDFKITDLGKIVYL